MGDVAEKRLGDRVYRVYGLQARAAAIRTAATDFSESIGGVLDVARNALGDWRGPLAGAFADRTSTASPRRW